MSAAVCTLLVLSTLVFGAQSMYQHSTESDYLEAQQPVQRIRAIQSRDDKDFVLGGLFPVHSDGTNGELCHSTRSTLGVDAVEAMLLAIDQINADIELLPNLTLGYDVRDTCLSQGIGLGEALDLANINSQQVAEQSQCRVNSSSHIPTLGIVGPAGSGVSGPIASLGKLFEIPQISYAAASTDFRDQREEHYTYFFRTILSDSIQAQATIDLVLHFNWNHISIAYSDNSRGTRGRGEIVSIARAKGICVEVDEAIGDSELLERYQEVADALDKSTTDVVILFGVGSTVENLLDAFMKIPNRRNLTWIASGGWKNFEHLIRSYNSTLLGIFSMAHSTVHVNEYQDYLSQLTINNNVRNKWFREFFGTIKSCTNSSCNHTDSIQDYMQGFGVSRTIEAVYTFAHALQGYLTDNCESPVVWYRANYSCKGQRRALNGPTMLEYITNTSFYSTFSGRTVEFNQGGNIKNGSYDIFNFQSGVNNFNLKKIGIWQVNGTLKLDKLIQFGLIAARDTVSMPPVTKCKRCDPGQFLNPDSSCCGTCHPCTGQQYSNDSFSRNCSTCDKFMWGNNPTGKDNVGSSYCTGLNSASLKLTQPWSIVMAILSLLGLIAVVIVAVVFCVYWNIPVIKSSGREQMVLLLIGIGLSYVLAFIFVSPPVFTICLIQRLGLWFCFSLMFGALMVKVIRVTRIFLVKAVKRPPFTTPKYQVLFTFIIVAGQMGLVFCSMLLQHPGVARNLRFDSEDKNNFATIVVSCTKDDVVVFALSLTYETAIIIATTLCGIISFKYPENFNEAKHISLCTFALAVIWVAFIPGYFVTASQQEFQNATVSLAVIMSASAVLVFNFGPRLFVIVISKRGSSHSAGTLTVQVSALELNTSRHIDTTIDHPSRTFVKERKGTM